MKQYVVTPAAGKRLIGKAIADHPAVTTVLKSGTLVILGGTTNSYVAEEVFSVLGEEHDFGRNRFHRGITLPPSKPTTETGRSGEKGEFPGDVILKEGIRQEGKTIFDVVDDLKEGDMILKGANALDMKHKRAAILVGHPKIGTIGATLQAVVGRRVQLMLPVGLEKSITGDLDKIANKINVPSAKGMRYLPVPGEVFTEIDAINLLTGAEAEVIASGGVRGAEGSVWLEVYGTDEQMEKADTLLKSIASEPPFA